MRDDLKSKEQEVRKLLDKGKSEQQVGDVHTLIFTRELQTPIGL